MGDEMQQQVIDLTQKSVSNNLMRNTAGQNIGMNQFKSQVYDQKKR